MLFPLLLPAQTAPPEPLKTSITVVGRVEAETPANITALPAARIAETPGANLDERLRDVPGFSLFRRSSSLVAHPTTQGVSLRGIGSSGASRSLVLWDGVPANDPFGGWVYWTQFIPDEMGRVEISRGASTSIFGDRAMGGVLALFSRPAEPRRLTASYEAGNRATHDVTAGYSHTWSGWAASGFARAFTTGGYFLTPEDLRGAIDRPAGVRFVTGDARLDYAGPAHQFFLKASLLAEDRRNGTALQTNSTGLGTVALHYSRTGQSDALSLTAFHTREQFHSTFSAIAADRNSERLTFRQTVPSDATGGAALWQHNGRDWNLLAGADVDRLAGTNTDFLFPSGQRVGGGRQWQHGVFAEGSGRLGPARLFLGARHSFTGQGNTYFSPSGGAVVGRDRLRARASVYRSFRAPTLNELFREFRVGNTVTLANPALRPETLSGAEAGIDYSGESAGARLTFYRNDLRNLITNVTLSATPALITRQRRNAAAALARGAEMETWAAWRSWRAEAGWLFADSRYPTGERIPQVPRWQGSGRVLYHRGGTLASAGLRSYGLQFEDDRNTQLLPGFATVQVVLRQSLARNLAATFEAENLLGRVYLAGFTPTPVLGAPRLLRVGLRWEGRL